jgi:hypothetical protein
MTIPVVQGVAVSNGPDTSYASYHGGNSDSDPLHRKNGNYDQVADIQVLEERRPRQFQDVGWAIAFYIHLAVMLVFLFIGLANNNGNWAQGGSHGAVIWLVTVCGLTGIVMATLALSVMFRHADTLVQIALVFSVLTSLAIGIMGFVTGSILMGVLGLLSFAIGICYARLVWHRLAFAAANLKTALVAIKANLGVLVVAYAMTGLAFAWTMLWMLGLGSSLENNNVPLVFFLFLSFYWVHQVISNTVHVTTAGLVGTFWFVPQEANSCCSSALTDSFVRTTTYSFGSVCFGSFLVALVQALRALEYYSRDNDELQFLSCIIQCILSCIQSIIEEFTKFAYVYVGLYGFSFIDAGKNVVELFQQRGWTVIITDDLADNVLFMMSVAVGLVSGLLGLFFGLFDSGMFVDFGINDAAGAAFGIGFLVGFSFASVIFAVVASAINTVIVCYCEAPAELDRHYPDLSANMRASWTQAWPELF